MNVFISYARKDKRLVEQLITHLKTLQRQKPFEIWYDRKLEAGMRWKEEIDQELAAADVILLLVSPDFLASEYCSYELDQAMLMEETDRAAVVPVLLRPVLDWKELPFARLQIFPPRLVKGKMTGPRVW